MASTPVIGLLGGGQLGSMLCEAANPLDVPIAILDAENAPAKKINQNPHSVNGSFKDATKVRELASNCDLLTVEIEHIDTQVLEEIASQGVRVRGADGKETLKKLPVHPSWKTLRLVQNKYEQKEYLRKLSIPIADQMAIDPADMLESMKQAGDKFGYPWMLKSRKDSYDGRGNLKVSGPEDLESAVSEFGNLLCYAEKWVPFELELSVMVIRTEDDHGKTKELLPYPAVETVHIDNVCSQVFMPPRGGVSSAVCKKAQTIACDVISKLWGRGVFAVEMFLTKDGQVLVNEIAPRPHNSGHLFIEAVPYMSQFKAQLTSILDEPLPKELVPQVSSSIMVNILGGATPTAHEKLVRSAKSMYGKGMAVYVHMYKKDSKPGRKIGHITLTGSGSVEELEAYARPLIEEAEAMRQERHKSSSTKLKPQASQASGGGAIAPAPSTSLSATSEKPLVLVTMGSDSDLPVLKAGIEILDQFQVPWTVDITSAHRTPAKMAQVANDAASSGIKVIIAAAGGAAHLPGMISAYTPLPVIGVPVKATHLDGLDSLFSIVQMPRGIPTAAVAINNSTNAALLAIRILGAFMPELHDKMVSYQKDLEKQVEDKAESLKDIGVSKYLAKMGK